MNRSLHLVVVVVLLAGVVVACDSGGVPDAAGGSSPADEAPTPGEGESNPEVGTVDSTTGDTSSRDSTTTTTAPAVPDRFDDLPDTDPGHGRAAPWRPLGIVGEPEGEPARLQRHRGTGG